MNTRIVPAAEGILEAADMLRAGELVAFPTETVYGLGADARRDDAVQKIYAAKGRPATNPLIVHVTDVAAARACAKCWPAIAEKLAERFWPGPLTLVVARGMGVSASVSAGRDTVALRCPRHPVAQALLSAFGGPVAAPSANRSGFTSPTTAAHVMAELGGRIPLVLDGGACEIGLESTVVDVSAADEARPVILRPGAVTREMIEAVIGPVAVFAGNVGEGVASASPGLLERHYAPRTRAFRFTAGEWEAVQQFIERQQDKVVLLTWDVKEAGQTIAAPHETMLLARDAETYGRQIYAALRAADECGASTILVLMPENEAGLWASVADRLRRATLPFVA